MSLVLQSSGGGSVTLQEAVTASNLTITVPAVTGTMLTTASAGTVLQVVNAIYGSSTSRTSSTFADTGLTASITPTSATSKILVFVTHAGCRKDSSSTTLGLRLLRNSTVISDIEGNAGSTGTSAINNIGGTSIIYLDSPATTSSTTYKTQFASSQNIAAVYINDSGTFTSASSITLMEIAA